MELVLSVVSVSSAAEKKKGFGEAENFKNWFTRAVIEFECTFSLSLTDQRLGR